MSRKCATLRAMLVCCIGALILEPAYAQYPVSESNPGVSAHHLWQYKLMKDMSLEMSKMSDEMLQGAATAEQEGQMAKRMERMSFLMRRMSGLESRPAMKESEYQKQMEQMRKQMDELMRDSATVPKAK